MGGGPGANYNDFGMHTSGFLSGVGDGGGRDWEGGRVWGGFGLEGASCREGEGEAGAEGERRESVEGFGKQDDGCE